MLLRIVLSVLWWFCKATLVFALNIIAIPLSLILAFCVVYREESETTGFPSMYPGKPRAFLWSWLRDWQSPDAPLDEWWYGDYYLNGFLKSGKRTFFGVTIKLWSHGFSNEFYEAWYGWPLRWWTRVLWLCRNAAYGYGAKLGFDAEALTIVTAHDEDHLWRTGVNCLSYWTFVNASGELGFCVRGEYYFYKDRCLECYLGYKLPGDTVLGRKFVAMQITPFGKAKI